MGPASSLVHTQGPCACVAPMHTACAPCAHPSRVSLTAAGFVDGHSVAVLPVVSHAALRPVLSCPVMSVFLHPRPHRQLPVHGAGGVPGPQLQ